MKEIHILVTGVGRRVELMQAFREAAGCLNINLKLYGADMEGTAPALFYCDYTRIVCAMHNPDYVSQLLNICQQDDIDIVIPTIDTDLLVLSKNKEKFHKIGVEVLISEPDKILICRDKNNTGLFFEKCGLKAPKTYNDYRLYCDSYPCFIKPKDGSSSINAYRVENKEELEVYASQIEDYVIQPFIDGTEYTIDIFCDFDGNPIFITPRQRMQIRAGEVLKTKICIDEVMIEESKKIISNFKPCGPITVQLIQDNNSGDNYYIEINPRYGGGAPLSMKSGARSAEALLCLLMGQKIGYQQTACNGSVYSRFDQSVCISMGDGGNQKIKGVIFDLDDTLYSEKEYVRSGYKSIGEYLGRDDAFERMWDHFVHGKPAIDTYLKEINLFEMKSECLNLYRNHDPEINLYDGVERMILDLKEKNVKVGIITDGRPIGQHKKIKALGLDKLVDDIIVTDELGGVQFRKPNDISFRIMQNRWRIPFEQIIYVADNISKDFQASRQLGMGKIYFSNTNSIYYMEKMIDDKFYDIKEIINYIYSKLN